MVPPRDAAQETTQTDAPDHLLIELCRRADFLGEKIDTIVTTEEDEEREDEQTAPLHEELGPIQRAIVAIPALTLAGAVAKASHVRWCRAGDLTTEMDGGGMDFEIMMSMVRDLLAIEAVQ
jgi:hypothetical protein